MSEDLYVRVVYVALIFVYLFCGVLRSCNLWLHTDKDMDELYPARRVVAVGYFSVLLLMPCVLFPQSPDARLLARCFWVLFIPVEASLSLKRFFYGDYNHHRLRIALVGGVPGVLLLLLSAIAWAGGGILSLYSDAVVYTVGVLSVLLTAYLLHVTLWLWHLTFDWEHSADLDGRVFPRRFALGIFWVPMVVQTVAWIVFAIGNTFLCTLFTAGTTLIGAALLVVILHPQRVGKEAIRVTDKGGTEVCTALDASDREASLESPDVDITEEESEKISRQLIDRIEGQIRDAVEHNLMFLDPNLSKSALASRLGVNEYYLYLVLRLRFGRFNRYVNVLRLKYALRYEAEHPDAKREEIAQECGFGSIRTYYRAKKEYEKWLSSDDALPKK